MPKINFAISPSLMDLSAGGEISPFGREDNLQSRGQPTVEGTKSGRNDRLVTIDDIRPSSVISTEGRNLMPKINFALRPQDRYRCSTLFA
jgi:hypothetical protein